MSNEKKPNPKSSLRFFNGTLSALNDKRLQLNRSKGLAKYLVAPQNNIRDLTPLDTTLGVMSFSLYMLRFLTNLSLLVELLLTKPAEETNQNLYNDLFYSLFNDGMWSMVNLTQFFWLSYKKSASAGLHGMQLETMAQLIDLLVTMIRYQQDKEEYRTQYNQATGAERIRLEIEWQHKEINLLRSVLTGLSIAVVFGLFSFSVIAIPLSPMIAVIILISSLCKILIDIERDKQLIQQLELHNANPQQVINKQRAMTGERLHDLNQIALKSIFLPMGFVLLFTTPIFLTVAACLSFALIHYLLTQLIDEACSPFNPSENKSVTSQGWASQAQHQLTTHNEL